MTSNTKKTWWNAYEETLQEMAKSHHFLLEVFNEIHEGTLIKMRAVGEHMDFEETCRQMGLSTDDAKANFARDIQRMIPVLN